MRIGKNPNKFKQKEKNKQIILFVLTHIPHTSGYHKDRITICSLCINSMIKNAKTSEMDYEVLVWDNGSCIEWRNCLIARLNKNEINQIVFSPNIGKCEAIKKAFTIIDSPYIMYTDDDVLFYPDYLNREFELLINVPGVALVGGCPIKSMFNHAFANQIEWLQTQSNFQYSVSSNFPHNWQLDHLIGTEKNIDQYILLEKNIKTYKVQYKDYEFWMHGHHMQFFAKKDFILKHFPDCDNQFMRTGASRLNKAVDKAGLLQITTLARVCRHIGNVLDDSILNDAKKMQLI